MSDSAAVQALLDREAIRDVLVRYATAIDRRDGALLRAVYHANATQLWGAHESPVDAFVPGAMRLLERYARTTHQIANERIAIDGDRARSECMCTATHRFADDPDRELVMQLRYLDDFERREGVWRITRRVAVHDWSREGSVQPWKGGAKLAQGAPGPDDPGAGRI